jgi:hypothetical protein
MFKERLKNQDFVSTNMTITDVISIAVLKNRYPDLPVT